MGDVPRIGVLALALRYAEIPDIQAALLNQLASPGRLLGEILVERRSVTRDQLRHLLTIQTCWDENDPEAERAISTVPDWIRTGTEPDE